MKKYLHIFLIVFLLWAHTALANTCAWVSGSTKNWSDATAWTSCGGVAPTAADDATVSGTGTLTVNGTSGSPSLARGVDFTGFTGTLSGASTAVWNIGDPGGSGAGVFKLVSGMTWSFNNAAVINFVSTTGTTPITTGTKAIPVINFNGAGGTWQLQDVLTGVTGRIHSLLQGTLQTNGFTYNPDNFTSQGNGTRALQLGASTMTLGVGSGGSFSVGTLASGLTISAGTSTINLPWGNQTIDLGDQTYATLVGIVGGGFSTAILTGNFTAASYSATPNSAQALVLEFSGNPTFTTSFSVSAFGNGVRAFVRSSVRGTRRTITSASNTFAYTDFQDIVGAGAGSWNLSAITGLSGDCGNNSGLTLTTPSTIFAKMGGNQLSWANGIWFTSSGGSTGTHMPLPQDSTVFDSNSITTVSPTLSTAILRIGSVNFTGVTNTPTLNINNTLEFYGPVTLVSGMSLSGTSNFTYASPNNSTFTTGGKTIPWPLIIDAAAGKLTLGDNATASNSLLVTSGTFEENSHTCTGTSYEFAGGTANINGTNTFSSTGKVDGGTVNLSAQLASTTIALSAGTTNDTGNSGEYKGTTLSCTGGTHTLRKLTLSSTFAASATCAYTLPAGANGTYATSWNESNTGGSSTVNGTLVRASGSYTVTSSGAYTYGP